jgi:hypothetical protein
MTYNSLESHIMPCPKVNRNSAVASKESRWVRQDNSLKQQTGVNINVILIE